MERFKMKQMNTEEKESFAQITTLKYHCPPGIKLKAYQDGWTEDDSREYHDELLKVLKGIIENELLWGVCLTSLDGVGLS